MADASNNAAALVDPSDLLSNVCDEKKEKAKKKANRDSKIASEVGLIVGIPRECDALSLATIATNGVASIH